MKNRKLKNVRKEVEAYNKALADAERVATGSDYYALFAIVMDEQKWRPTGDTDPHGES